MAHASVIFPDGFGFGTGSISRMARLEGPDADLTPTDMAIALELLLSGAAMAKVEAEDDGCGDGRDTLEIFRTIPETHQLETFKRSLVRAKVFGGGPVVAPSMYRALAGAPVDASASLFDDRKLILDELTKRHICFGAHTDDGAQSPNCGCGALDKYLEVSLNILHFKKEITATCRVMLGEEGFGAIQQSLMQLFNVYELLAQNAGYFNVGGAKTIGLLGDYGAVVKKLTGMHREVFVLVNDVPGTSFDSQIFQAKLRQRGVTAKIEVFCVDAWRGRQYADVVTDYAVQKLGLDGKSAFTTAQADFLTRTLATSGTLTVGDLPVIYNAA